MVRGRAQGTKRGCEPCCDMRGLLSFLILFLLSKKPMHGQALAVEIGKRKGSKPSPGTIYPALGALKDAGFVREQKDGKAVVYRLTPHGQKALAEAKRRFCAIFVDIVRE